MIKLRFLLTLFFVFGIETCLYPQDTPPSIIATGNQNYCTNSSVPIVTSVSITDADVSDNTLGTVSVQISEGYVFGADQLQLTGTHPNIVSSWDANQGKLLLNGISGSSGTATFAEFEAAIIDVIFLTTQTVFTEDRQISINLGGANYLPSTGHYYFYEESLNITWLSARSAAAAQNYFGLQGYLATLTSIEEAQLSGEQASGTGWIGASDELNEGTWRWVTGPEGLENSGIGRPFWQGTFNGGPINGEYSKWNTNEPNQSGNEDYAHIVSPTLAGAIPGSWNDLANITQTSGPYQAKGYIVEFGGMPGDPIINLSASTTINTPRLNFSDIQGCENQVLTLSLNTNIEGIEWYETATSSTVINTGDTYTTTFSESTILYISSNFPGCAFQNRLPLNVTINDTPVANTVSPQFICDDDNDGFWDFNLDALRATILGTQSAIDFNVSFHTTEIDALTSSVSNPLANSYQNQVAYTQETVWVRIENTINTNCFSITSFDIAVFEQPMATPFIYQLCDNAADGDATNGEVIFNLPSINSEILGAQDPTQFTVSYYLNATDANLGLNPLPSLYTNTTANTQDIFVRVQNNSSTDCYATATLTLQVDEIATANAVPPQLICDDDNDGFWDFNLEDLRAVVLGTQSATDFNVSFHNTESDAMTSSVTNPLASSYQNQVAYTQETLWIRIENTINTDCFDIANFTIDVFDQPFPIAYVYELCDDSADGDDTNGFVNFPLSPTTIDSFVLNGQDPLQFTVTYHLNQSDADNDLGAITNLYTNDRQIIARVENNDNILCYATVIVDLQVNALPVITNTVSLLQCDIDTDCFSDYAPNLNRNSCLT